VNLENNHVPYLKHPFWKIFSVVLVETQAFCRVCSWNLMKMLWYFLLISKNNEWTQCDNKTTKKITKWMENKQWNEHTSWSISGVARLARVLSDVTLLESWWTAKYSSIMDFYESITPVLEQWYHSTRRWLTPIFLIIQKASLEECRAFWLAPCSLEH
jgi:hypothetical protein